MRRNTNEWLDHKVTDWVSKGWITEEAREKIRKSYGRDEQRTSLLAPLPLYAFLSALGFAAVVMAVIWGLSQLWYYVSVPARMALASVLLLVTQAGVGLAMFQKRQGSVAADGIALIHCLGVFVVMAMAEQTFYIGWDVPAYVVACAILCLPVVYLLCSVAALIVYDVSILYWTAAGGPINTFGGTALLWLLLLLAVPFYNTLINLRDERRLSVFSWVMTITVFIAFGLAARTTEYISFLLSGSLAVTIMLVGYSIDIHQSWGVPFRWFGRFAAVGSLLVSCLPFSWDGVAQVQDFHWTTDLVTVLLFVIMAGLMAKTVKKRLWGPVLYLAIPVILAFETLLVRSALYSSIPLILSSLYIVVIAVYETAQGFKPDHKAHMQFGVVTFISLVLSFVFGTHFSPLAPILAIIILALIIFQFKRTQKDKTSAAQRASRRARLRHSAARIRNDEAVLEEEPAPEEELPVWYAPDEPERDETVEEWMKDIRIPSPSELGLGGDTDTAETMPAATENKTAPPLVFNLSVPTESTDRDDLPPRQVVRERTEAVPQQMAVPQEKTKEKSPAVTESPWSHMKPEPKRKKHFTQSPWSHQGGKSE
ncbi:DUF2157 domain-containing protein [uncultured Megasphaera sp.]|uniref:DUF2157 domain-containing protein n=1 Tax=uncultured Megasphaera sp. TaxID=165188 RepID=UPI0025E8DA55|nr:DUF2157 domain-containing protein [uncultured Megasphaera sp.]